MPELPEVETVVRDLRPLLVGQAIRGVRQSRQRLRRPWEPRWKARVVGTRVEAIRRRGKWIVVDLLGTQARPRLILHLGMTGQLTVVPADTPRPDHLHLVFELDNGTELRFRDVRRFGSADLSPDEAAVEAFFTTHLLGPEPFDLDAAYFRAAVRAARRSLKAILLDQGLVAGVGNIYADEACHRAGLHPARLGRSLSPGECECLREAIVVVLERAIAARGSSIRDYIGGSGLQGGFQSEFAVYGRTGEACYQCGTAIARVRLAGRSSHFCARCQPLGRGSKRRRARGARGKGRGAREEASP